MNDLFNIQQLTQYEFGAILLTVLIAGLVIGTVIGSMLARRSSNPKVIAAAVVQEEFDEYRDQVNQHFIKTTSMFQELTLQYKSLYDHMSVGADDLCRTNEALPKLEFAKSQPDEPEIQG